MRKTKAFVIVKELCGDAISLTNATHQEVCIDAAFESIKAGISIINYFIVKKNAKERIEAEDAQIVAEAETYCIELKQETEEMRRKIRATKDDVDQQQEKYHVLLETIQVVARELNKTIEFVTQRKEALSKTEDDIKQNQQRAAFLDDWVIKSTKQYIALLKYYQIGDDEDE